MLSYRHAFHAGNFADVHKHVAWMHGILALQRKPAPFRLLDAYAGAGSYDLHDAAAQKTREWQAGVERLLAAGDPPPALQPYLDVLRALNPHGLAVYPGSPALAASLLREQDRLVCLELHPADFPALKKRFADDARIAVHRRDAREGLPALVPPAEKRGLVLIDPPYEQASEYADIPEVIRKAWKRWPTGSYLLWYPLLAGSPHAPMLDALATGDIRRLLVSELMLFPQAPGLRGSGLAWINPPWQADAALRAAGAWLRLRLGDADATDAMAWRVPE